MSGYSAGGGAGNPGGVGKSGKNVSSGTYSGKNGTGGLLILCADTINNQGTIASNGSSGGQTSTRVPASGGSSGGGSINIFYKTELTRGTITANGGPSGASGGAAGGNGSITVGSIATGNFICEYKNY